MPLSSSLRGVALDRLTYTDAAAASYEQAMARISAAGTASPATDPFHGKVASKPSLIDISDAIHSAKPYDQIQISKNYVGLSISWPVVFSTVNHSAGRDVWYVIFASPDKHFLSVYAEIEIEKYPKLKIVDSGHPSWIEGRIESASISGVALEAHPEIILE